MKYDVHMERSAGWSALAFVIVTLIGVGAAGMPPPVGASGAAIAAYATTHHGGLLVAAWIQSLVVVFFLWFVVGLRGFLRDREGATNDGLPAYLLLGGLGFALFNLIGAGFTLVMAYAPAGLLAPAALETLTLAAQLFDIYAYIPAVVFVFAAAHSMRRHAATPAYLARLGYLAALLLGLGTLTIFPSAGAFAVGGAFDLIAMLVLLLWVVLTGVFLIRRRLAE